VRTELSIVICTFNRDKNLKRCLASLAKQTFNNFEIIIVDGGSTDKTNQVIKKWAEKLRIKKITYLGTELAKVRDQGWRKAKGGLVSWIDDDVVVSKNWAKEVATTFQNDKTIGGVTGPTIIPKKVLANRDVFSFYHKKGFWKLIGKFWEIWFLEGGKYQIGKLKKSGAWTPGSNFLSSTKLKELVEVDYLEACNMTLKKNLIARVRGFDYGYKKVAEWCELDLAIKVKNLGYRLVFNPKAVVHHHISQGGVYSRRTYAKQRMENFFKFYFAHIFRPRADYLLKFTTYLVFLNFYWGYKALFNKNINWLGGWIGTFTGLKHVFKR